MYTEVLLGMYLCKSQLGIAYYLVNKDMYDQIHTQVNGQNPRLTAEGYVKRIDIRHLLHNAIYPTEFNKIQLVEWSKLAKNYQLDAIASNEEIRKKYYEEFYGTKPNQVSQDLKGKLFAVVDDTTKTLRTLRATGTNINNLPVLVVDDGASVVIKGPTKYISASNHAGIGGTHYEPGVDRYASTNNSGNTAALHFEGESYADKTNTMDLLSNIPGMNLNFGKLQSGLIALGFNGELAFSDKKGGFVTIQHEGTEKTRVDVGSLKLDVDFYKVPTQDIEEGDVILLDNDLLLAGKKTNGETKFINPITGATTNKLQRTNILGMYFYTKIVSLFDMVGGTNGGPKGLGLGGLNPMTLMLLSGQGGLGQGGDLGKLLLFSQLGQGGGDANSMLPLLLMSGGLNGGTSGGIEQLMLMNALSGNKGGLGNLFGGKKKAAPVKPAVKKKSPVARKRAATARANA